VRAVAGNDDWVDTMEKWGNARAVGFWEAKPPSHRAGPSPPGAIASRGISDFIRAKYTARLFAAAGEPGAWHATLQLSNGWTRMWDGGSRNWYYACGEVTAWEAPPESTLYAIMQHPAAAAHSETETPPLHHATRQATPLHAHAPLRHATPRAWHMVLRLSPSAARGGALRHAVARATRPPNTPAAAATLPRLSSLAFTAARLDCTRLAYPLT
jgi:hypothetical protein